MKYQDYYIPDPIEREELRAEEMIEKVFDFKNKPNQFLCFGCNNWKPDNEMNPSSPDPACYPICNYCCEKQNEG